MFNLPCRMFVHHVRVFRFIVVSFVAEVIFVGVIIGIRVRLAIATFVCISVVMLLSLVCLLAVFVSVVFAGLARLGGRRGGRRDYLELRVGRGGVRGGERG